MKAQAKQSDIAIEIAKACSKRWLNVLERCIREKEFPFGYTKGTSDSVLQHDLKMMSMAIRSIFAYPYGNRASDAALKGRETFNHDVGEKWHKMLQVMAGEDARIEAENRDREIVKSLRVKPTSHGDFLVEIALRNAMKVLDVSAAEIIRGVELLPLDQETYYGKINELVQTIVKESDNG